MKRLLFTAAALCCTLSVLAQPQLRKDNIDEVLKAKAQSWPVNKVLLPKEPVKEITLK